MGPDVEFKKGFKVAFMIMFKELKENMVLLSGQTGSLWNVKQNPNGNSTVSKIITNSSIDRLIKITNLKNKEG